MAKARSGTRPPPRPRNCFLIFRQERAIAYRGSGRPQCEVSHIISREWNELDDEGRARYVRMAEEEKEEHRRLYPNYKYAPVSAKVKEENRLEAKKAREARKAAAKKAKSLQPTPLSTPNLTPYGSQPPPSPPMDEAPKFFDNDPREPSPNTPPAPQQSPLAEVPPTIASTSTATHTVATLTNDPTHHEFSQDQYAGSLMAEFPGFSFIDPPVTPLPLGDDVGIYIDEYADSFELLLPPEPLEFHPGVQEVWNQLVANVDALYDSQRTDEEILSAIANTYGQPEVFTQEATIPFAPANAVQPDEYGLEQNFTFNFIDQLDQDVTVYQGLFNPQMNLGPENIFTAEPPIVHFSLPDAPVDNTYLDTLDPTTPDVYPPPIAPLNLDDISLALPEVDPQPQDTTAFPPPEVFSRRRVGGSWADYLNFFSTGPSS